MMNSLNNIIVKDGYSIVVNDGSHKDLVKIMKSSQALAITENYGLWNAGSLAILDEE